METLTRGFALKYFAPATAALNQFISNTVSGEQGVYDLFKIEDVSTQLLDRPQIPWGHSTRDMNVDSARGVGCDVAHLAQYVVDFPQIAAPGICLVVIQDW